MEKTSSWSDLPQCLAELILKHLSVPNCLCFGSVCRSWCLAQRQCPHRLEPPFIVFYRSAAAASGIIEILSLPDQRTYKMPVRLNLPFSCVSSSHGWMLLQTINRFILVKNNECVNLPMGFHYLDCLFFSTPSDPDGILFVRNSTNKFMLYRRSDRRFDEYDHWNRTAASNTIFHEGKLYTLSLKRENKRKFQALNEEDWSPDDGYLSLMVVDPLFPCNTTTMKMKLEVLNSTQLRSRTLVIYHAFVLVESYGEILMVRIMENHVTSLRCDVFQADFIKMEWINVENLGDRILFLSHGGSVSICASEMGWKENRIYYIPNTFERSRLVYMDLDGTNGSYMEFKLGRDGVTIHPIPVKGNDCVIVDAWLTPCDP